MSRARRRRLHRIARMDSFLVECNCGKWALRLRRGTRLSEATRYDHLLDAWFRHEREAKRGRRA